MTRLATLPAAEQQLLAAIATVPAGTKLSIPFLRNALVSQADVLAALQRMVERGKLDRATLRPRPVGDHGSAALVAEIEAFCARTGMSTSRFGKGAVNDFGLLARLKLRQPRARTVARIRAFIEQESNLNTQGAPGTARKSPSAAESTVAPASPERPAQRRDTVSAPPREEEPAAGAILPPAPTGAELAAKLDALIAAHGLSKTAVSKRLFGSGSGIDALRKAAAPMAKTIAKIEALIADPPIDELRLKAPLGDRRFAAQRPAKAARVPEARRAHPSQPDAPLDLAERQRLNGQRHFAANRRASERVAARLVDEGADPGKQNSMVKAQMREIERRRAEEDRQTNPVEQAKLALQRKGRVVYAASVHGGAKDRYYVSGVRDPAGRQRELTSAELIAMAEQLTGKSLRRSAA